MAWPAAGASKRMRSAAPARSSCFTLPRMRMSLMPGTAVETMSSAPEDMSRFETRAMPWSWRYSINALSGVSVRPRMPGDSSTSS